MNEDAFIKKFCEKPFPISALSRTDNHFYDLLGFLHILLVKNHKKKFYLTGGDVRNVLRVSKVLKVPCKKIERPYFWERYQSKIIDKYVMNKIVEHPIIQRANDLCFSMNEKSITELIGVPLTARLMGELFEYPRCCIDWFYQSQWKDLEVCYEFETSRWGNQYDPQRMAKVMAVRIIAMTNADFLIPELEKRLRKIAFKNDLKVREKFPFVFHQACDSCVDNRDSPTGKLNKIYAEFAKKKYPDLYNLIISESKKEIKKISGFWKDVP